MGKSLFGKWFHSVFLTAVHLAASRVSAHEAPRAGSMWPM
jgi:hypothetical protein